VLTGVFAAAVVSFLVGTAILRLYPVKQEEAEEETLKTTVPGSAPAPAPSPS
jgi:uncharacterized membrane protein YdcZ (DUF606 family)